MKIILALFVIWLWVVKGNGQGKTNIQTIIKLLLGKVCLCKCGIPNFALEGYKSNNATLMEIETYNVNNTRFNKITENAIGGNTLSNTTTSERWSSEILNEKESTIFHSFNKSIDQFEEKLSRISNYQDKPLLREYNEEKLIGGDVLGTNGFPWLVLIIVKGVATAGGAIITDKHIVSAASPFVGIQPADVKIAVGVHDRCKSDIHTWNISVSAIAIHPAYLDLDHRHDIAILTLSGKIIFNKEMSPICLSTTLDAQRSHWVASWLSPEVPNLFNPKPELSCVPKLLRLPTLTIDECLRASPPVSFLLTHDKFCLGPFGVRAQICSGDVGSPVQYLTSEGRFELSGILIDVNACDQMKPVLFIRIDKHITWIKSVTAFGCVCNM